MPLQGGHTLLLRVTAATRRRHSIAGTKFTVPTMILIGEKDDWTPAKLCNDLPDETNLVITTYPNAEHAFANPDVDMTYLASGQTTLDWPVLAVHLDQRNRRRRSRNSA
jgi:dienelactone hydrolase